MSILIFWTTFSKRELTVSVDHKRPHRTPASPSHRWQRGKEAYPRFGVSVLCVCTRECACESRAGPEPAGKSTSSSLLSPVHTFRSELSGSQGCSFPLVRTHQSMRRKRGAPSFISVCAKMLLDNWVLTNHTPSAFSTADKAKACLVFKPHSSDSYL